ncbi:cytidine deaminase [Spiroplasma litorale]|uniref:Cytidine deaminase n=1 Tax=Spiroplasma litorale TaxID=216942 RepID=A0A0K1W1H4_9MOLU|nr:cytidine deaminase [Spiroplasma litorale]AKX33942.1 cytidine deaminase [Spiroplasma litorale]
MNLEKVFNVLKDNERYCYTPYSRFNVVCSLYLKDDTIINGVNIENAAYNPTICAERSMIAQFISKGYINSEVDFIALYANSDKPVYPCGTCRQTLAEFFSEKTKIYIFNSNGYNSSHMLGELLPYSFNKNNLE